MVLMQGRRCKGSGRGGWRSGGGLAVQVVGLALVMMLAAAGAGLAAAPSGFRLAPVNEHTLVEGWITSVPGDRDVVVAVAFDRLPAGAAGNPDPVSAAFAEVAYTYRVWGDLRLGPALRLWGQKGPAWQLDGAALLFVPVRAGPVDLQTMASYGAAGLSASVEADFTLPGGLFIGLGYRHFDRAGWYQGPFVALGTR